MRCGCSDDCCKVVESWISSQKLGGNSSIQFSQLLYMSFSHLCCEWFILQSVFYLGYCLTSFVYDVQSLLQWRVYGAVCAGVVYCDGGDLRCC
jgi:hypothetical protein